MNNKIVWNMNYDRRYMDLETLKEWSATVLECFEPDSMKGEKISNGRFCSFDKQIYMAGLEEEIQNDNVKIHLTSKDNNCYIISNNGRNEIITICVHLTYNNDAMDNLIDKYMRIKGIVAHKCSSEDDFWQNIEEISYYKMYKRSTEGMKTTIRKGYMNDEIIDIEYNPGHYHIVDGLWFGSCYKMWFGSYYYNFISKQNIQNFTNCYEKIEEAENEMIGITLYEDIFDYENETNRQRQLEFRRQALIDEVAHDLIDKKNNTKPEDGEQAIEILNVKKDGKEYKVVNYYYDDLTNVVPKKKAVKKVSYVHSLDGKLLYSEEEIL